MAPPGGYRLASRWLAGMKKPADAGGPC